MKFFITGGTGFVGRHLCRYLLHRGETVVTTGTSRQHPLEGEPDFTYIRADTAETGPWMEAVKTCDTIINLAGRNIFRIWTEKYKAQIRESRVRTTRNLTAALPDGQNVSFLSTSAVGYYGSRGDEKLDETSTAGDDFLARVSIDWEKEAFEARKKGVRVSVMRFGIVLGTDGGALQKMLPAFRSFAGGRLGSGRQWFPWIHIEDVIRAVHFLSTQPDARGIFNFCAPEPMRQREFARTLGRVLNRTSIFPTPGFLVRLVAGELGDVLLSSQRATPENLASAGFEFSYPDAESALRQLLKA